MTTHPDPGAQWRPIDGEAMGITPVDLWLQHRKSGREWRVTDCRFSGGSLAQPNWISPYGHWVAGKRYYDWDGDECFDPDCRDEDSTVVVAWMPPPGAPTRLPPIDEAAEMERM